MLQKSSRQAQTADRRFLIIGNSHVFALRDAAKNRTDAHRFTIMRWDDKDSDGKTRFSGDAIRKAVAALTPSDLLIVMQFGNKHHVLGLLNTDKPFTVGEYREGYEMIPTRVMGEALKPGEHAQREVAQLIKDAPCPAVMVAPPPVKADNDFILAHAVGKLGPSIQKHGITDASLRHKLREIEMTWLQTYAASIDVPFMDAPAEAYTADGYLAPVFYQNDATHANAAYGAVMLDCIASL